jgi:protein-disulfide isomerase
MHDLLYARQSDWSGRGGQPERFARYAEELDLDAARFAACLEDRASRSAVERNDEIAKRCRVRGTPTFFINGERIEGALPTGQFLAAIAGATARSDARRPDCLN